MSTTLSASPGPAAVATAIMASASSPSSATAAAASSLSAAPAARPFLVASAARGEGEGPAAHGRAGEPPGARGGAGERRAREAAEDPKPQRSGVTIRIADVWRTRLDPETFLFFTEVLDPVTREARFRVPPGDISDRAVSQGKQLASYERAARLKGGEDAGALRRVA